jgi:hypothetical protein
MVPAILFTSPYLPLISNCINRVSKHFTKNDAATCTMGLHQLRNIILVGIFVGSNSFIIAYAHINNFPELGGAGSVAGIRSIVITTFLFCSFLSWAMVIRCASHLGYTLGVSADDDMDETIGVSYVNRMVRRDLLLSTIFVKLCFIHRTSWPIRCRITLLLAFVSYSSRYRSLFSGRASLHSLFRLFCYYCFYSSLITSPIIIMSLALVLL